MKIVDKLAYAIWIYDNTCSTTVGFYKVTGEDLKQVFPQMVTFNKRMAGKVEVHDPMPWGDARKHTWQAIVDNGFDKQWYAYAHCGPDGVNMSDDDMFDYWLENGSDNAATSSLKSRGDFLEHLSELSDVPTSTPAEIEANTAAGS